MENFKTLTDKRGHGRSPEVVFDKRLQLQGFHWENFGLLQMKSLFYICLWVGLLRRGGGYICLW